MKTNVLFNGCGIEMLKSLPDNSVDCILTDPPYLYLKNQKLDRPFDENAFFSECKRVLKKDGFIVLFGRGTSFYRWNTILADLGFKFKEEIVWDKSYCSSPLMAISRVHETVSIHTKGNGTINKVKVPYLEMKGHDIPSICQDIRRMRSVFKNTKSLDAVLSFLENNKVPTNTDNVLSTSISSIVQTQDRCASVLSGIRDGMNEKSIIRTDLNKKTGDGIAGASKNKSEKSVTVMQAVAFGMNEKSIIREGRNHYKAIHPTEKPVRLIERLLALVTKPGDIVCDPFGGSFFNCMCLHRVRKYIYLCRD